MAICQINRVGQTVYKNLYANSQFGTTNILVGFQTKQARCVLCHFAGQPFVEMNLAILVLPKVI